MPCIRIVDQHGDLAGYLPADGHGRVRFSCDESQSVCNVEKRASEKLRDLMLNSEGKKNVIPCDKSHEKILWFSLKENGIICQMYSSFYNSDDLEV